MKIKVIVIIIAVVVLALVIGIAYYVNNVMIIPDKDGMVYASVDSITSCRYESGGGMNGELTEAEICLKDNGEVWLKYHYRYPVGSDKEDIRFERQVDFQAITDVREICNNYGVLCWGKLKRSDIIVLDGATDGIALKCADGEYYSVNTGLELPDGGEKIFDEILQTINKYKQGDD